SDATVRLWDIESGQELKKFTRHEDSVISVAFTPDGRVSVSGSRDGVVKPWTLVKPAETPVRPPEGEPVTLGAELKPAAVVPVGGTVSGLFLSPDRKALYYFNLTDGKVGKVDLATRKRERELRLADGTEAMALTRDGKGLYAVGPAEKGGQVQLIDPVKLELRSTVTVPDAPYDVAATDGGQVFLSGRGPDWASVTVVDANRGTVAARWGGFWNRSFLQLTPNQERLYVSTQGVSPGYVESLALPAKPEE